MTGNNFSKLAGEEKPENAKDGTEVPQEKVWLVPVLFPLTIAAGSGVVSLRLMHSIGGT